MKRILIGSLTAPSSTEVCAQNLELLDTQRQVFWHTKQRSKEQGKNWTWLRTFGYALQLRRVEPSRRRRWLTWIVSAHGPVKTIDALHESSRKFVSSSQRIAMLVETRPVDSTLRSIAITVCSFTSTLLSKPWREKNVETSASVAPFGRSRAILTFQCSSLAAPSP